MRKSASMLRAAQQIENLHEAAVAGSAAAANELARLALETLKDSDPMMWPDAAEEILQHFEQLAPREADEEEGDD